MPDKVTSTKITIEPTQPGMFTKVFFDFSNNILPIVTFLKVG